MKDHMSYFQNALLDIT